MAEGETTDNDRGATLASGAVGDREGFWSDEG